MENFYNQLKIICEKQHFRLYFSVVMYLDNYGEFDIHGKATE